MVHFPKEILINILSFCGNTYRKKLIIHLQRWFKEYVRNLLYLSFYNSFNVYGGIEFRFHNYYFSQHQLRVDDL